MLARIDETSADIAAVETRIEDLIAPFVAAVEKLDEIIGVGRTAAHTMIAEVGLDMSRFPTAAHLCSWARFAPGVKESAGKSKGRGTTPEAHYHDLGSDSFDHRMGPERKKRTHIRQLEALGYKVTLEPGA